jgi:hypothetical protein
MKNLLDAIADKLDISQADVIEQAIEHFAKIKKVELK